MGLKVEPGKVLLWCYSPITTETPGRLPIVPIATTQLWVCANCGIPELEGCTCRKEGVFLSNNSEGGV